MHPLFVHIESSVQIVDMVFVIFLKLYEIINFVNILIRGCLVSFSLRLKSDFNPRIR